MPELPSWLDPKLILVDEEHRQRQEKIDNDEDFKTSIKIIGMIEPIVVNHKDGNFTLMAGGRRLKAALELGLTSVPIRPFNELSVEEAEVVELEENIKRKDLSWRDQVRAIGRIHLLYKKQHAGWSIEKTAGAISMHHSYVRKILHIFDALDTSRLNRAQSIDEAYNILHRSTERRTEAVLGDIVAKGTEVFGNIIKPSVPNTQPPNNVPPVTVTHSVVEIPNAPTNVIAIGSTTTVLTSSTELVLHIDFLEWLKTYSGPKFSLVHCDFPQEGNGKIYWTLLDALLNSLDRVVSHSAHLVFWFDMDNYTELASRLGKAMLSVHAHPFVWYKTQNDAAGAYATALIATRGNRPLVKPRLSGYAAPEVSKKVHPQQQSESVLQRLLSMFVNETTTMLDPTCGSGAALRAAEDLGAKTVLGLEVDKDYAAVANAMTLRARVLRQAGAMRKEELL